MLQVNGDNLGTVKPLLLFLLQSVLYVTLPYVCHVIRKFISYAPKSLIPEAFCKHSVPLKLIYHDRKNDNYFMLSPVLWRTNNKTNTNAQHSNQHSTLNHHNRTLLLIVTILVDRADRNMSQFRSGISMRIKANIFLFLFPQGCFKILHMKCHLKPEKEKAGRAYWIPNMGDHAGTEATGGCWDWKLTGGEQCPVILRNV